MSRHTLFRPCIDLHDGQVKQIVGGTLDTGALQTNFVSSETPRYFAELYRHHGLSGGHIIKLGPNNDAAASEALQAWPGGFQLGGGITVENADYWLDQGAGKVIVTSWLFPGGTFAVERLRHISEKIGTDRLVVDLSCRSHDSSWVLCRL
ncbi:Enzyme that catalyzes the fourth step in the histidine pathway [Kappamyces sp. JEL0680]|nr:Enzyme that catalyzes the fourth step in the histidine pathway [Kappamyces sp. JEL0680]